MATAPFARCKARAQQLPLLLLALAGCLALASAVADAGDSTNTHRKLMQAQGSPAHTCPSLDGYIVTVNGHVRWDQEYRCEYVSSASALLPACTPTSVCKGFIVRTEASGALRGCLLNNAVPDAIGFWHKPTCLYAKQAAAGTA